MICLQREDVGQWSDQCRFRACFGPTVSALAFFCSETHRALCWGKRVEILVAGWSVLTVPGGGGVSGVLCWDDHLDCLCWREAFGVSVRGWGKREPCSCWGQRSGKSVFIANGMLNFRDGVSGPLVSLSTVYSY